MYHLVRLGDTRNLRKKNTEVNLCGMCYFLKKLYNASMWSMPGFLITPCPIFKSVGYGMPRASEIADKLPLFSLSLLSTNDLMFVMCSLNHKRFSKSTANGL